MPGTRRSTSTSSPPAALFSSPGVSAEREPAPPAESWTSPSARHDLREALLVLAGCAGRRLPGRRHRRRAVLQPGGHALVEVRLQAQVHEQAGGRQHHDHGEREGRRQPGADRQPAHALPPSLRSR